MPGDNLKTFTRREALAATVSLTALAGCPQDETPTTTEVSTGGTASGSNNVTPSPVTNGLQLWLTPESGYSLSNGSLSEWTDESGNGNDMTQSAANSQPSVASGAANGYDAVQFDGANDYLQRRGTIGIPDSSARTFVIVSRLSDLQARSPFLMQGELDAENDESNFYGLEANTYNTAGERYGVYLVSSAKDTPRRTDSNYNLHVLRTADFPETGNIEQSTTYYINGTEVSFSGTPGGTRNQFFSGDTTTVGAFPTTGGGSRMHGEIAEVRVYDRAISDTERSQIESALLSKYAIGQPPATATPS